MIKSQDLIYGEELLKILDEQEEISFEQLEEKSKVKGDELKELLRYLVKKDYLRYNLGLFITYVGDTSPTNIGKSSVRLLPKGMEVVLGQREYFSDSNGVSQKVQNQTNVSHSSGFQVAQTAGDNNQINQSIDNSKVISLREEIEKDQELEEPKKKELLDILDNINTVKESGQTAVSLIKKVSSIAVKYLPSFLGLFN